MNVKTFVKEHKIELSLGAAHGVIVAVLAWLIQWAPVAALTAFLYAWGGDERAGSSAYRRVGVPAVVSGSLIMATGNWWYAAAGVAGFGTLSIGYGLPSTMPPDDGSVLGRFVFKTFGLTPHDAKDEAFANIIIRGLLFALFVAPYIVIKAVLR